ncbi:MAG: hypothetical protein KAW56_16950 [Candidatus Marinimicrobia bacterium]|nr:hypothetical protein [Candidatus Neomarinimicrobiota bacterium]
MEPSDSTIMVGYSSRGQDLHRVVFKVTAADITELMVTEEKIGPGGELNLMMNRPFINQMDVETGEETKWAEVGEKVSYGDFDSNGNFYVIGRKSDLFVIVQGDTTGEPTCMYTSDEIICVYTMVE